MRKLGLIMAAMLLSGCSSMVAASGLMEHMGEIGKAVIHDMHDVGRCVYNTVKHTGVWDPHCAPHEHMEE